MQVIHLDNLNTPISLPKLAFTIGNFDGVHLGHQKIINRLKKTAQEKQLKTALMFFEPQPKEYFASINTNNQPLSPPARISSMDEKINLISKLGLDYVFICTFDDAFRKQNASEFAERLKQLNIQHIMVGDDFRFGHDRSGDSDFLEKFGFDIDRLDTQILQEERISSTRIRDCLALGDFESANALLGRAYSITGKVEKGDQIGRTINFPTANIALNRTRPCLHGIYAVEVACVTGNILELGNNEQTGILGLTKNTLFGAAHIGTRPAIKNKKPEWRLEVNFPKFEGDLYGKELTVTFLHFLHGEKNYESLPALQQGIADDVEKLIAWRTSATAQT